VISAVFDTNGLASGFTTRGGVLDQSLRRWLAGEFELVVSEHILTELERTFRKPYFFTRLGQQQIADNLALLRRRARLAPITVSVQGVATHPEDDRILATAVSAQADYLVTGDRQLQALKTYRGVRIVSPRTFNGILEAIREG
jgi:uncharacterized protein